MAEIRIENVVASTAIASELDLNALAVALTEAEYDPGRFPGLVLRMKEPKTAALLFRSGKVVCTGAQSIDDVTRAITLVCKKVETAGSNGINHKPAIEIQNIVASSNLHADLNLNAIAMGLGLERVEYEPEQFPGLVYRMADPRVVLLLFGSGKLVCTGAKKPEDASRAVDKVRAELSALGLL
jgi:transcription initiation factor TFIID TATA-box-binding protein